MPSPQSPLTALWLALKNAPTLNGWNNCSVFLGSRWLTKQTGASRIVLFPDKGIIGMPYISDFAIRNVEREVIAHLWARDFDEMDDLYTRFFQALEYQASPNPASVNDPAGTYWLSKDEDWDTTPDENKQGESVAVRLVAYCPVNRASPSVGLVSGLTYAQTTTTLAADMGGGDSSATVVSVQGFPRVGIVQIEAEQILYTNIIGTTLTGLRRAQNGTIATNHITGVTVGIVEHT